MSDAALALTGVSAWYGHARALFDISLDVRPGEIVALLGRNGAGKTTTLRAVMGVETRRTGDVTLHGRSINGMKTDRIARLGVGWVPEDRRIFPNLTVRENLRLAQNAVTKRDRGALPLEEIFTALPIIEKLIDRRGSALSGGEQQAVAIARALAARPRVLLLDEPTEGLAPVIVRSLRDAVADLPTKLGVSIVIAEQNLAFVKALAQRVFVLDTGRLVYQDSTAAFGASEDLQRRYLSASSRPVTRP
jgi:branched-chain amino acid transport system ATP-binding protein